ncbi:MAG: HEAT repeat domain-containing protein [Candidatus Omnitrophota bacterium]|nr:HEAT repeat domain-containing protein [Candidatus Omnitrophota bacterium]
MIINLKNIFKQIAYTVLSLGILLASSYVLSLSFIFGLSGLFLTFVVFAGGMGVLLGLFYSVENIKRLFGCKVGGFSFGVGKERKRLTLQQRLALTQLADEAYSEEKPKIQPSLTSTIAKIFSLKGIILMAIGTVIAFYLPHSSDWFILGGALFAAIVPYLISVTYNFFCSNIDHYKFRSEFVRQYLEDIGLQNRLSGELSQVQLGPRIFLPFKSIWNNFSLKFPVIAGILVFILGKVQVIFWGAAVGLALIFYMGANIANIPIPGLSIDFIPHTLGDIIRLSIIAYVLIVLSLPYQIKQFGFRTLPVMVVSWIFVPLFPFGAFLCLVLYPIFWILSLCSLKFDDFRKIVNHNFMRFWANLLHIWIIAAIIGGVVLNGGPALSQHLPVDVMGESRGNIVRSFERQYNAIYWGDDMLNNVNKLTGIDFPREIYGRFSGKLDKVLEKLGVRSSEYPSQEILIKILEEGDYEERKIAAVYLRGSGDYKAAEPLMKYLERDSTIEAIDALLVINDPKAMDIFINGLKSDKKIVRTVSALWLGKHEDSRAVQPLIEALSKERSGFDITKLDKIENIKDMSPAYAEAVALAQINGPDSISKLIDIAMSGKSIVGRQAAIISLGLRADNKTAATLIRLAKDSSSTDVKIAVAFVLRNFDTPEVKDYLYLTLKDKDTGVKLMAASSLVNLGYPPKEFSPELVSILENKAVSPAHRVMAARILADMKEDRGVRPFIVISENPSEVDSKLQEAIIYGLGKLGGEKGILALAKALSDSATQQAAIISLAEIKSPGAFEILRAFVEHPTEFNPNGHNFQVYFLAISSLKQIDPLKTEQILLGLLPKSEDVQFIQAALFGLADSDTPIVTEFMLTNLKNRDPRIRYAIASSLASKVSQPQIKDTFINILKFDPDPLIRSQVAISLGGIDDLKVKSALKSALSDPHPRVRAAAILSLIPRADFDTIQKVKVLLADPNIEVRKTAEFFLTFNLSDFPQNNTNRLAPELKLVSLPHSAIFFSYDYASLNTLQAQQIEPGKSVSQQAGSNIDTVLIISGVYEKNPLGRSPWPKRNLTTDATKNWPLRRTMETGGIKVIEHRWRGVLVGKDFRQDQLRLDKTINSALETAKGGKIGVIAYSGGNEVAERLLESNLDPKIKRALNEQKIHIISLNSSSKKNFGQIDPNWKNIWSPEDWISKISAKESPNEYEISIPDLPHLGFKDLRAIYYITNNMFGWKYDPTTGSWPGYWRGQSDVDFRQRTIEAWRQSEYNRQFQRWYK